MGASCGPGFHEEVGVLRLIVALMTLVCLTARAEAAGPTASAPGSGPAGSGASGASGAPGATGASGASGSSGTPASGSALPGPFLNLPLLKKGSAPPGLGSPRAAVTSYLLAARAARYDDAANYLDLSDIP